MMNNYYLKKIMNGYLNLDKTNNYKKIKINVACT